MVMHPKPENSHQGMSRVASSQLGLQSGHPFTPIRLLCSGEWVPVDDIYWCPVHRCIAVPLSGLMGCQYIYTRLVAWWWPPPSPSCPDTHPYYIPTWLPVLPRRLAYHWTDWEPTKSNVQLLSCWQQFYVHGIVMACEFCLRVGVSCWTDHGRLKLISMAWCGCAVSPVH